MGFIKKTVSLIFIAFAALIVGFDLWGAATLGTLEPKADPERDATANRVVAVFGGTGSVGDGFLKAALADPEVEKVYAVTRRLSPRMETEKDNAKLEVIVQEDFTDYTNLAGILPDINTVLWGLGTTSIGMDDDTYTWIHVDFPLAFAKAWLASEPAGPMSFHYITGMGTDPNGSQHWAREKGRAELTLAKMGEGNPLRAYGYRSAFVRPTSENANAFHHLGEVLLKPGSLVITATELGQAMLEIAARTAEVPNGALIDNEDSIRYAKAYAPGT